MEENLYDSDDKKQRMRIIIATTVASLIVLGVAVWAIIAIVTSGDKKKLAKTEEPETSITESVDKNEPIVITPVDNNVEQPTPNTTPTAPAPKTETTPSVPASGDIPTTGPEEIIPIAFLAGALVAYLGSVKLVRDQQ